ncbi:hypothetical protein P0G38_05110 [Enterococcus casseliflavus]|uniref:hypothetical protein n=1 Tax=Enterococcus casseliflavus TaxID=37734 RepID=UPI0023DB284C|nr:hypothetical protein [Enterococcus casseliflavus]WEL48449.1 hypothetical protein P0G38_05110 [Enterococcus casseliflavus]
MQYKNTKTGVTFSSPCVVSGGDWILITDTQKKENAPKKPNEEDVKKSADEAKTPAADPKKQVDEKEEQVDGLEGITKKQIMQELDAFGIEYNAASKKAELYELMMSQGK